MMPGWRGLQTFFDRTQRKGRNTGAAATRAIAAAEALSARVIGITGSGDGRGQAHVAHELASLTAQFGRRTLLIAADANENPKLNVKSANIPVDLPGTVETVKAGPATYLRLSLAKVAGPTFDPAVVRSGMIGALDAFDRVIVELPPAVQPDGPPNPVFLSAGAACDAVFLVCRTGALTEGALTECLDNCRIGKLRLAGLLLDDTDVYANQLLGAA
jgi:Mrp family chromosome partitioning ATPase